LPLRCLIGKGVDGDIPAIKGIFDGRQVSTAHKSLNGVENGPVRLDGFAFTFDGAKAELTLSWRAWLAAAGLTERARAAAVAESDSQSA
jgi:hypothetical protein